MEGGCSGRKVSKEKWKYVRIVRCQCFVYDFSLYLDHSQTG